MSLFTVENNIHFLKIKCLISSNALFKYSANVPVTIIIYLNILIIKQKVCVCMHEHIHMSINHSM